MTPRIARLADYVMHYDLYPPIVSLEYDRMDLLLSDPMMDAKRLAEYLLAQDVQLMPDVRLTGFVRFDGTMTADLFHRTGHRRFREIEKAFYNQPIDNLCTFEWQHSSPDFNYIIRNGYESYLDKIAASREEHKDDPEAMDFLDACEVVVRAFLAWQEKCRAACARAAADATDPEDRARLEVMAETFAQVPGKPARTFREAVQCLSLCFIMLPDCMGTVDRYLYPYYIADLEAGRMTRDEAKELMQELFVDIYAHTGVGNSHTDLTAESHFAIGGYWPNGEDGFTDLSRLIVEALMEMPINKPQISLRWTEKLAFEDFRFVLDCERHDPLKRIAIVNDEPRIRSFMENLHLSYEDAVNYTMVGCNEPLLQGGVWLGGCTANVARSVTRTLARREEMLACGTFDEFYALFEKELHAELGRMLYYSDRFNYARSKDVNIMSSIILDGCIESARSATRGGARLGLTGMNLMGTTCVIDSLSIIRQFVFEEKTVTMAQLLDALETDWQDAELLRRMILKKGRFFGNNDPLSDEMATRFTTSLHGFTSTHVNLFGKPLLYGCLAGYNPHYVWFGNMTSATPDGRHSGDPFMVGAGQSEGKDRSGLTGLLNSVAQMDPWGVLCGPFVCNLMLDETLIRKDENFEKTARMLEAYFKAGGLHVQLNYVSKEELLDAKAHPEKYGNLRVRVSGFSGTFTLLQEAMQDEIVRRTSQK